LLGEPHSQKPPIKVYPKNPFPPSNHTSLNTTRNWFLKKAFGKGTPKNQGPQLPFCGNFHQEKFPGLFNQESKVANIQKKIFNLIPMVQSNPPINFPQKPQST